MTESTVATRNSGDDARAAHAQWANLHLGHLAAITQFANTALLAALTINGGAAVACLAFIGSVLQNDRLNANVGGSVGAMVGFSMGTFLAALATALAYCAQHIYGLFLEAYELRSDYPYVVKTAQNASREKLGLSLHIGSMFAIATSYALFVWGMMHFAGFAQGLMPFITKSS